MVRTPKNFINPGTRSGPDSEIIGKFDEITPCFVLFQNPPCRAPRMAIGGSAPPTPPTPGDDFLARHDALVKSL